MDLLLKEHDGRTVNALRVTQRQHWRERKATGLDNLFRKKEKHAVRSRNGRGTGGNYGIPFKEEKRITL